MQLLMGEVALGFRQPGQLDTVSRVADRCLALTANLSTAPISWWAWRTREALRPLAEAYRPVHRQAGSPDLPPPNYSW